MILFCERKYRINVSRNKYLHLLCFVLPILSFSHENLSNPSGSSYRFCSAVGKFVVFLSLLFCFLNGRRPPAGDDTGALHIPSLHPSARLGNITQIEDRRNNQSCLNVQRPTGNVENKRRFLTRETAVCFWSLQTRWRKLQTTDGWLF